MSILKSFYTRYCPNAIKKIYRKRKVNRILSFYEGRNLNDEEKIVLNNIQKNGVRMFPYQFVEKYNFHVDVQYDPLNNKYVLHNNKKLFFPNDLTPAQITNK